MKYIKLILILSLQYFILCKVIEDEQNIYKFSLKQINELTNLDSNNINFDIIFNIYSREKEQNKGWILVSKYLNNNKNYFKSKDNKKYTKIINEDNYKLILNQIDIEEFEDPNFSFNKFSYLKSNKDKKEKLKFVNNSPLIKITFTKNGIINIYRPDNIPDLIFFDFVQSLNRIIFTNKDKFFTKNIKEEKSTSEDLKDYCENRNYIIKAFSFKYFGISIKGYINAYSLSNNEMGIIFKFTYKILKSKEQEIYSFEPYRGNSQKICYYINKLKEYENFILQYISKDNIKKIVNILKKINQKDLFNDPLKILISFISEFSNEIMNFFNYLLRKFYDFINQYFKGNKLLIQFLEIIIFLNKLFMKSFFPFGNFNFLNNLFMKSFFPASNFIFSNNLFMKSFFPADNNIILKQITKNYKDLMNSNEFKKIIVENMRYSKENFKELKSSCEDISNSIGNKMNDFFNVNRN